MSKPWWVEQGYSRTTAVSEPGPPHWYAKAEPITTEIPEEFREYVAKMMALGLDNLIQEIIDERS